MQLFLLVLCFLTCIAKPHASPHRAVVIVEASNEQFELAFGKGTTSMIDSALTVAQGLLGISNGAVQEWDAIFDCRTWTNPEESAWARWFGSNPGSGGADLVPSLEVLRKAASLKNATGPSWQFVAKSTMSCLHDTILSRALLALQISELYVMGFNTENAIFATVFDAWRSRVVEKVFLVEDAVASAHGHREHALGMDMIRATVCSGLQHGGCPVILQSSDLHFRSPGTPSSTANPTLPTTTTTFLGKREPPVTCDASWHQTPYVGVNLGGWLVAENWMWRSKMVPNNAEDEWTLVQALGGPDSPQAQLVFKSHWDKFVKESDLDKMKAFGISHVRIPIGYWLLDFDINDGFVDGGKFYLDRLIMWLKRRCMRAVFDLHALPGGQEAHESFTGKKVDKPYFFLKESNYLRGKKVVYQMADLMRTYETNASTSGVVLGLSPVNEPSLTHWIGVQSQQDFYHSVITTMRDTQSAHYLDPDRYVIFLNYMGRASQFVDWLVQQPWARSNIVLDKHVYHVFDTKCDLPARHGGLQDPPHLDAGADHGPPCTWPEESDSCKSCCRDRWFLEPVTSVNFPLVVGEWSVATITEPNITSQYRRDFFKQQLAYYAETPGMQGSFFWSFTTEDRLDCPKEWCLLRLIENDFLGTSLKEMDLSFASQCPKDLSQCPDYSDPAMENSLWKATCEWQDLPCNAIPKSTKGNAVISSGEKVSFVASNGKVVYVEGEVGRLRCASAGAYQELQLEKQDARVQTLSHGDVIYLKADVITWDDKMYYLEVDWEPSEPGKTDLVRATSTFIRPKGMEWAAQAFTVERAHGPGLVRSGDTVHLRTQKHTLIGGYNGDVVKSLHHTPSKSETFKILAV